MRPSSAPNPIARVMNNVFGWVTFEVRHLIVLDQAGYCHTNEGSELRCDHRAPAEPFYYC